MKSSSLNSPGDNLPDRVLCFYTNVTSQLQIIKITNITNYSWQRAIFPDQKPIFAGEVCSVVAILTKE
jgi:Domain of unknown function (DUF1830)